MLVVKHGPEEMSLFKTGKRTFQGPCFFFYKNPLKKGKILQSEKVGIKEFKKIQNEVRSNSKVLYKMVLVSDALDHI